MKHLNLSSKKTLHSVMTLKLLTVSLLVCLSPPEALSYDRQAAKAYAHKWAIKEEPPPGENSGYNRRNYHDYTGRGGDCTNFVSQCLRAGGIRFRGVRMPGGYNWEQGNVSLRIGVDDKGCITKPEDMAKSLPKYHGGKKWETRGCC